MRRIKDKMMISILTSMAILLIGLAVIIACYIYTTEQDNLLNRNLLTARSYASQTEAFINKYDSIAQTLSYAQISNSKQTREDALKLLKKIADKDESVLGSWVIYEADAFD